MNKNATILFSIVLIWVITPVSAYKKQTFEDSLKTAEILWDKGYSQYEIGNYEAAYTLFSKSYSSWKRFDTIKGDKNPYKSMNHCLFKMGKTDLVDKENAPYYYEELDTTDFYSTEMQNAYWSLCDNRIDSAFYYFQKALKSDTLINRQNRKVHAQRYGMMAMNLFDLEYYQQAINCYKTEYNIMKNILPEDKRWDLNRISEKIVDSYLRLGKGDSALAAAIEYVNIYKNKSDHFWGGYDTAESTLFYTYLRTGKYKEAYKELLFADSVFMSLEKNYYNPLYKKIRESEYYAFIGRFDKAYKIQKEIYLEQEKDSAALMNQDMLGLAISSGNIGNYKLSIEILENLAIKFRYDTIPAHILDLKIFRDPIRETSILGDFYYSDGNIQKALEKYLWIDSIYTVIHEEKKSYARTKKYYPDEQYISNLYKLSRYYYSHGKESLGDLYYRNFSDEIKKQNYLNRWEIAKLMLDAQKYYIKGDLKNTIVNIESYLEKSGDGNLEIKEWLAYLYLFDKQTKKAYDIEAQIIDHKRKTIIENFEELSENERYHLWNYNTTSFRNLAWSILMLNDSSLMCRLYNDVALFSKGLMLTVSSTPDFKRILNTKWEDIRQNLKKNELAVEFITIPEINNDPDSTIYIALCIKNDINIPKLIYIGLNKDFDYALSNGGLTDNQILYEYIWEDIEKEFKGVSKIYFSADGILHKIPIEYLEGNKNTKIQKYRLTSTREIALGRIPYEFNNAVLYGGLDYKNKSFNHLDYSQKEVDTISHFLNKSNVECIKYCEASGTKEQFLSADNKSISIMHFATHGIYSRNDGTSRDQIQPFIPKSEKILANDLAMNRTALIMSNGTLTASEIANTRIKNLQLVTLSACKSALGDISDGEGVFGLQRAFKQVGAKSILMSLWDIEDKATSEFMGAFYKRVSKGESLNTALRKAQEHMKTYKKGGIYMFKSTKYWAGFIILDAIDN